MNAKHHQRRARGYISYVMVLSIGAVLTMLMIYAYRSASRSMVVSAGVQQRTDYLNKEDAALRSLLSIVPNRAIRAMQSGANASTTNSDPLRWQNIFSDALTQGNARTSISDTVAGNTGLSTTYKGNSGDSSLNDVSLIFEAVAPETGYIASGCSNSLGNGFPVALNTSDSTTAALDALYPIISSTKYYGTYASGKVELSVADYPQFNKIRYPQIDFGYAQDDFFVAKRNWWAFSVNIFDHDDNLTGNARLDRARDYVLSIYEIPSQLSISANAFTALGKHESGDDWGNQIQVKGQVFAGKAQVEGSSEVLKDGALSSRRGMALSNTMMIGGQSFQNNPFTSGFRQEYEMTTGKFFPVSMSSETGRAAFVPINRGNEYYDRFAQTAETLTLSPTTWNNYSIGALQCAMKLDVTGVISATNQTPTSLRFTYKVGGTDVSKDLTVDTTAWATASPQVPFDVVVLTGSKPCVVIKPELFSAYLTSLGADSLSVNNSIVVNADYTFNTAINKPSFPCLDSDIGLVMTDCTNLTSFPKGFSVVTNFRLYIADDFNIVQTTPPTGSGIATPFYPPASLYAPERRFGSMIDPWKVNQAGTVGSLASDDRSSPIRPFDMKTGTGTLMASDKITVNLKPISHPAALPPITMMNWLIVLEERRAEFYTSN